MLNRYMLMLGLLNSQIVYAIIPENFECTGTPLTQNELGAYLDPGSTWSPVVGERAVYGYVRKCNSFSGCAKWTNANILYTGGLTPTSQTGTVRIRLLSYDRENPIKYSLVSMKCNADGLCRGDVDQMKFIYDEPGGNIQYIGEPFKTIQLKPGYKCLSGEMTLSKKINNFEYLEGRVVIHVEID